jgi:pimeloyl-ACP methyl ester carboxylesterase
MASIFPIWTRGTASRWYSSTVSQAITAPGKTSARRERYRFVAATLRYCGTSPWPDDGAAFSMATHADDLAAFIRQLRGGPAHVAGWSCSPLVHSRQSASYSQSAHIQLLAL